MTHQRKNPTFKGGVFLLFLGQFCVDFSNMLSRLIFCDLGAFLKGQGIYITWYKIVEPWAIMGNVL